MAKNQTAESSLDRASESSRKQRAGTDFTGAFGKKTGSSDLLFLEGQLPEQDEEVVRSESPPQQLEICLENLEVALSRHGRELADVLQLTLYLADMESYEQVNEAYERVFDETCPARTTVGVCNLLGGAAVSVDAVVPIE